MKIYFDNRTTSDVDKLMLIVEKSIKETISEENCIQDIEVSVSFVTDDEIRKLNLEYREKDSATDVLSFPMNDFESGKYLKDYDYEELIDLENPETKMIQVGDIVVSLETIERQAKEYNNEFEKELSLMVIHSMLHLMGYDHIEKEEEKIMFDKQEKICGKIEF